MSVLSVTLQGRTGNQCLQWLFCYGFAQKLGLEFQCPKWIGERIFLLPPYSRPDGRPVFRCNEITLVERWRDDRNANWNHDDCTPGPMRDFEFRGYAQTQFCADQYTKRQAQSWLKLRPEIEAACQRPRFDRVVCHRRAGDYFGYGYPVVSGASYFEACVEFGIDPRESVILSEELSWVEHHPDLPDDLKFVSDFYRMMRAKILLRGNSTFSWLAALLGDGLVLSPVIDGLEGGKEHFCRFVAGNHPKFCNLDFVENLYVAP